MAQRHLFIVNDMSSVNPELDTSFGLATALQERGCDTKFATLKDIWLDGTNNPLPMCQASSYEYKNGVMCSSNSRPEAFEAFDACHMRVEPPVNTEYLNATWLIDIAKIPCINATSALRGHNEKLIIAKFPEHIAPYLVDSHTSRIAEFIDNVCKGDAVIKPLDLYSGKGIQRLKRPSASEISQIIASLKCVIVQPFDKDIFNGEVRVFTSFGNPSSWCLKVPSQNNFLANTSSGATLQTYTPSPKDLAMVTDIAQKLQNDGIYYTGVDIIGGKISEINITSPRLLELDTLKKIAAYSTIAQQTIDYVASGRVA